MLAQKNWTVSTIISKQNIHDVEKVGKILWDILVSPCNLNHMLLYLWHGPLTSHTTGNHIHF